MLSRSGVARHAQRCPTPSFQLSRATNAAAFRVNRHMSMMRTCSLGVPSSFSASAQHVRWASGGKITWTSALNPFDWGFVERETQSPTELKEKLPEIFTQQPVEVQDYIRPETTMFEKLEDWWDWAVTFLSPVDKQVEWMRGIHASGILGLDVSWGMTFVLWGGLMRGISLVPMLYAHRNTLRLAAINPQLNEITQKLKQLKQDKTLTSAERRIEKEGYNRMRNALYTKHQCSQYRSFMSGISSPLLVTALLAIRRLAMYEDDLEHSQFLWVSDLTLPDPTYCLPIICSAMFLMNFELNQGMNRGGRSAVGMYMRWGVRVLCVVMLYFFNAQPSAIFAYWIGLSGVGMLQPWLLRSTKFRRMFNFPPPPAAVLDRKAAPVSIVRKALTFVGMAHLLGGPTKQAVAAAAAAQEAEAAKVVVDKQTGAQFKRLEDTTFEVVFDLPDEPNNKRR